MIAININTLLRQLECNDSTINEIIKSNPKQFISDELSVPIWQVTYRYTTSRGNEKEAIKYIFLTEQDWDLVENEFNAYIKTFNKKYPYKQISNVKILDVEYMGNATLPIEH